MPHVLLYIVITIRIQNVNGKFWHYPANRPMCISTKNWPHHCYYKSWFLQEKNFSLVNYIRQSDEQQSSGYNEISWLKNLEDYTISKVSYSSQTYSGSGIATGCVEIMGEDCYR